MSLSHPLSASGIYVQRGSDAPITRFQVLGERSSGTNYVKRLLGRNTGMTPTETLGWKHAFPHMMAIPSDMAVIISVRRADAWARSMFSKPWHTTPALQSLPFSEFIRAEWDTIIDRPRYFEGLIPEGAIGSPLQQDRDPMTGARFANLFALRTAKLNAMLSLLNRDCTCAVVRMEDATGDPHRFLAETTAGLGINPPHATYRPVVKRLGSKFKAAVPERPALPDGWSATDMDHLRQNVDTDVEAKLGYTY